MLSHRPNARQGFTLTEIMIVLVVLGLLMAVALPRVSQVLFTGKVSASKTSLGSISKACKNFNADMSCWPGTVGDLMTSPVAGGRGYHAKTLADLTAGGSGYTAVQIRNWKGPYVDGTPAEVSVDAWGAKIAIGIVDAAGAFKGYDMDSAEVSCTASLAQSWIDLGSTPGLYLHSKGDDTATGTPGTAVDDLYVFVSSKTQ